jgi:2-dehydro-3-deoxyphosphogluconate aldolase / (4S)-4-hydroxy-2-oxoglutarate aldolase
MSFEQVVTGNPVIPVVTLTSLDQALPLVDALLEGGISIVEITLRTPVGMQAIEKISASSPDMTVGAGTVKHPREFQPLVSAGARFAVSPAATASLIEEAARCDIPFLPGAGTPGEILTLMESGYYYQKLFPADIAGGINYLNSLSGPFPEVNFCPSGGVGADNFRHYLDLTNVFCASGSWITAASLIEERQWSVITRLAKEASR